MNFGLVLLIFAVPSIVLASHVSPLPPGLVVHLDAFTPSNIRLANTGNQDVLEWTDKVKGSIFKVFDSERCPRWEWTPINQYWPNTVPCRPIYLADQINNGGVVRFDGGEDYLQSLGDFRTPGSLPLGSQYGTAHVFFVGRRNNVSSTQWQRLLSSHDGDKAWDDWQAPNWEFSGPRMGNGTEIAFPASLFVQRKTNVHIKNLRLATKWNGQWTSRVDIAEIMIFERILTDAEEKVVTDMLELKWGFRPATPIAPDSTYDVPTAGYANYVGRLRGSEFGANVQRYVKIRQDPVRKEWTNLKATFSIEAWFKWDPPAVNPLTGACCVFPDNTTFESAGIFQNKFHSIISRHPGQFLRNAWSHFNIQLTRTPGGVALAGWAGCGCTNASDVSTCDVGYTLNTDSRDLPESGRRYIIPNRWYHFAMTFDGDGTSTGFETRQAKLYLNGEYLINASWGGPIFDPISSQGICRNRPMMWNITGGWSDEIRLGFYSNHDGIRDALPDGTPVIRDYGFSGKIDEIRIWNRVIGPVQVSNWWDVTGSMLPWTTAAAQGLVAYYNFVGRNINNLVSASGPVGMLANNTMDDAMMTEFWGAPWEVPNFSPLEVIHSRVDVVGRNRLNTMPPAITQQQFRLEGYFPDMNGTNRAIHFRIESLSPYLSMAIDQGLVQIGYMFGPTQMWVNKSSLPSRNITTTQSSPMLTVSAECVNATCGMLGLDFRYYWVSYRAFALVNGTEVMGTPARAYFAFTADCQKEYDACGVCGGDNRTCQCVWYLNYKSSRMAHTLLTWSVDHILEKINCSISALKDTLTVVQNPHWEQDHTQPEIIDQIEYMMGFYNNCLNDYCKEVFAFQQQILGWKTATKRPVIGAVP